MCEHDFIHFTFVQWDTAGQERFKTITASYYRNTQGIMLVYDVTNRASFTNIRSWVAQIQQHVDPSEITKILVGNKCDLLPKRVSCHVCR